MTELVLRRPERTPMRQRLAALLCSLALIVGVGVTVAPSASASASQYICYYKWYPKYVWTNASSASYLEGSGAWSCYRR